MSRNWQLVCYFIAAIAFVLAAVDFTPTLTTRRRNYAVQAVNWVGLGLLAWLMVTLVSTINAP